MTREGYDVALLVLIIVFMVLKALLIERKTRLGWAMATTNVVLAIAFTRALLLPIFAWVDYDGVGTLVRLGIAASIGWCTWELVTARWIFVRTKRKDS
jgi:hypothetical protein